MLIIIFEFKAFSSFNGFLEKPFNIPCESKRERKRAGKWHSLRKENVILIKPLTESIGRWRLFGFR